MELTGVQLELCEEGAISQFFERHAFSPVIASPMLRTLSKPALRAFTASTGRSASTLVIADHDNATLGAGTLNTITAATALGGERREGGRRRHKASAGRRLAPVPHRGPAPPKRSRGAAAVVHTATCDARAYAGQIF